METKSSAKHLLSDPWRNNVGAQQERYILAFDFEDFVVSKPQNVPFSLNLIEFCFRIKNLKPTRRVQDARKFPWTLPFKKTVPKTADGPPPPRTCDVNQAHVLIDKNTTPD